MSGKKYQIQKYPCTYCGTQNEVKIPVSDLLFEGNYPLMQAGDRRPEARPFTFTCNWCKRKNSIVSR